MASILLENVSVHFPIFSSNTRSLKRKILQMGSGGNISTDSGAVMVQALSGVSLEFSNGDRVGLCGQNGSGKTTLLRVIAGIYEPTGGRALCEGHITPLFDPTLGMEMEATGFENIFFRGLLLGLRPAEIRAKTEEIAEFTELGNYLSMPVRLYSSGMMLRLAFSISTCFIPEILLLDEWIAVGDHRFMEKAQERMGRFVDYSHILVLASHSEDLIRNVCNKAVLLDQGKVVAVAHPDEIFSLINQ